MILNGSKCPMCGCIKTAETKEVKKTPQPEKKIKTNKKPVIETFTKDIKTEPEKIASKNGKYLKKDYKSIDDLDDKTSSTSYNKTNPEWCFYTTTEAENNGFRAPRG